SYLRLGQHKAPAYVSWSAENRSQLVRIPAAAGEYRRMELRSPDPAANPYLAFALMIYAGLEGIKKKLPLGEAADLNLYKADPQTLSAFEKLPETYQAACTAALESDFIKTHIPSDILDIYGRA
ncbi:MAG: type I glutamate--ammonia ligase, partial [Lachnospiraceae bacterium]|nr:type I glutamate--ammonia ligase [Lachnospiraceae bacterium]